MLKLLRIFLVLICCILICVLGTIYSFIRFKNPSNVGIVARWFGRLYPLFGLKVEHRVPQNQKQIQGPEMAFCAISAGRSCYGTKSK